MNEQKRVEIIANRSVEEDIMEAAESCPVEVIKFTEA